jgi:hypothetical protein
MSRAAAPCLLVAVALLSGCGGGVDERKAERLRIGMSAQDVEAIMGKGKEVSADEVAALMKEALAPAGKGSAAKAEVPDTSGLRGVRWGDDGKSITVIYAGGRVARLFKKGF